MLDYKSSMVSKNLPKINRDIIVDKCNFFNALLITFG